MRRLRRQESERRHAAGRWMDEGSPEADRGGVPDSAAAQVVAANGSAYRALLGDAAGVDGGLPDVPEERWRSWLLGGTTGTDLPESRHSLPQGAHRAGRRWACVEPEAGPVVVRAERSSSVASRSVVLGPRASQPVQARRHRRALVMAAIGVVALGVGLSLAGWHAQAAAWQSPARVRSVSAGRAVGRASATAVEEEV